MDPSDKVELAHAEEMAKPVCMCQCHAPGSQIMHCVACCGPGTAFRAPDFVFAQQETSVCKCQYGGFPWNEHDEDCPELKKAQVDKETISLNDRLRAYISGQPNLEKIVASGKTPVDAIIEENISLKHSIKDAHFMREQAQMERNSLQTKLDREHKDVVDQLNARLEAMTQQAADGWKHPEEVAMYVNKLEKNNKDLRKLAGHLFSAYLEELFTYIEEDTSGARLEQLRPELEVLAKRIGAKIETNT